MLRLFGLLLFVLATGPLGSSSADAQRWAGPIPTSVTAQNGVLYLGGNRFTVPMTLSLAGSALVVNGMMLPADTTTEAVTETAPTRPDLARVIAMNAYLMLLAYRRHLDDGGLIICLRHREFVIPIRYASLLDGSLSSLLTGRKLSAPEESQLRNWVPADRWEEASRVQPLVLSTPMLEAR